MEALQLGIFAALLQIAGYTFYGSKILRRDILPNPTSWLMFAYGTTFLLIVEWDRDASLALLALPAACALSSIVVAFYALRKTHRWWWPEHVLDRFSFGLDVALTIVYVTTWLLLMNSIIFEAQKDLADIAILIFWNIGTFTAFFPLARQVYHNPATEHATPWLVWTCAYFVLTLATLFEVDGFSELLIYPLINLIVHGAIAFHVSSWRRAHARSIV